MLGISLSKLLVLVLLVAAVWYGFRWVGRRGARARLRRDAAASAAKPAPGQPGQEDLTACPACGTYTAPGLAQCPEGRADCPRLGA